VVTLPNESDEKKETELKLLSILLKSEHDRLAGAPTKSIQQMRTELDVFYAE
jgi:hypothetical protein